MTDLRTLRSRLSPFAERDSAELLSLFRDPGVRRFLLDDTLVSEAWVQEEIQTSEQRFRAHGGGLWSVRLIEAPEIIGFVGFREFFDPPQLQLIYGLAPDHWGQGLAVEVAARICRHGFDDLRYKLILAAVDVPNRASIRVLERLGMEQTRITDEGDAGTVFFTLDPPPAQESAE